MESNVQKLLFIAKLNNLNENLRKCERIVNKVNENYNVNEINNKFRKTLRICVECNAFDVNEDKQRQCYKQLKCFWPKCRFSAKQLVHLNDHISRHLNKRQFVCEECNKQFNRTSHLLQHKLHVHSNERPFVCKRINCNKTFKTKSELTVHNSRHSSVKSFGCDKCYKRFKTYQDLNYHKNFVHTNIRSFVCPRSDCNQSFKQRSGLRNHKIRFHSDIKRYKCLNNNCDKSFVTSTGLKQHIGYKHSTERPFKCDLNNCHSSFKSPGNLYTHKKRVHITI